MLMAGKQVTQQNDPLHQVDVQRIYRALTDANGPVADKVRQLRTLKSVQPEAYRRAKTGLPYIVTACFMPAVRNKSNFSHAEHFIIDIDKISDSNFSLAELKRTFRQDQRVLMMFTSPGNDGLKLLFRMSHRITDSGLYSTFYKIFTAKFSEQYQIPALVDRVTHDVSRCCFMSFDPDAYLNVYPELVDPDVYARMDDPSALFEADREMKRMEEERKVRELAESEKGNVTVVGPADDVLTRIRQKLLPSMAKVKQVKEYFQPAQLLEALPGLSESLATSGITLSEHRPIQYGRQLKLTAGQFWAEVNLFYGKHSFRAVMTTKTGSHPKLAELGRDAVQLYFDSLMQQDPLSWQGRSL